MQYNVSILICRFPHCCGSLGLFFFLEMVGLGNSCRGMKSPPLLVAALLACIIVLGFNYWIASSRSVDLQVTFLLLCISSCTCVFNKHSAQQEGCFPCMWWARSFSLSSEFSQISQLLLVSSGRWREWNECLFVGEGDPKLEDLLVWYLLVLLTQSELCALWTYLLLFQFTDVATAILLFFFLSVCWNWLSIFNLNGHLQFAPIHRFFFLHDP